MGFIIVARITCDCSQERCKINDASYRFHMDVHCFHLGGLKKLNL